jgi:hypothetical protein
MARAQSRHSIDVPRYLWEVLDAAAAAENVTTAQLIATWLTEAAHRHAEDTDRDRLVCRRLAALPVYDGRFTYQRRVPAPGRREANASL